jgi:S1-C subfamily serine protease
LFSEVNVLDVLIALFVLVLIVRGARTGFLAGAFSLAGVVLGAAVGSRLAPLILSSNEDPVFRAGVTLASILAFAVLGDVLARMVGASLRSRLNGSVPTALDGFGGAALGLTLALVLVWLTGIFALQSPVFSNVQPSVQQSRILQALEERMPSQVLADAVSRLDPIPQIQGPDAEVSDPNTGIARDPQVLDAADSMVKVTGLACGYGVEGSGWVASPELVVTNAHVVAGQDSTRVQLGGTGARLPASPVLFDPRNDIAILRVDGLDADPLKLAAPDPGKSVAVLGFPGNGPLDIEAGRTGSTRRVLSGNAYGRGPVERLVTSFRVSVKPGNSGGPAVNADGEAVSTIFASRANSPNTGYGIPSRLVRQHLQQAQQRQTPVPNGTCAP